MKYAMIIPDGAADVPLDELGGRTPLAAANTPNIDWITAHGKCGTVANVPDGMEPGSDVAMLSVFGYHPREYYTGRAPLEAAAQELKVADDEWVLRCNIVTIIDGKMIDHSAGHISSQEGAAIINELNGHLGSQDLRFYPGVSYRHLLVLKGELAVKTTPPHDILGQKADDYLPKPFNPDELVARIEAVKRRLEPGGRSKISEVFNLGHVIVDFKKHKVLVGGEEKYLTRTEWLLLSQLINNAGRLMLYEELLTRVWGPEYRDDVQLLRTCISRLRHKLESDPNNPKVIRTVPKTGYIIDQPPA